MEQEEGIQVVLDQNTNAAVKSRKLNETVQEQITQLEITNQENILEQEEGIPEDNTELNEDSPDENGRDCEFVAGARPKIKEQVQGGPEEFTEPSDEILTRNEELVGAGQDLFRRFSVGTHKKILRQAGRSWEEVTERVGTGQSRTAEEDRQGQEAGLKLVRDLLAVVTRSDLPLEEKLELEFVTLQFMMGGNVHLLGELQSQAVVENFRQEVFAKFPIPAFHVTSSVICCDQAVSQWPERSQLLNENGCSRQQERIYSQLIFFLCRAPFLKSWDQLDRLAEMLHKLKNCIYYNPVALVGVIVQVDPDPGLDAEQEARARRWLRCLLDGFFCCDLLLDHDGTEPEVQVQVAVYQSGQPERALEVKRAACQAIRAALKF